MRGWFVLLVAACGRINFGGVAGDGAIGDGATGDAIGDGASNDALDDAAIDVMLAGHDEDGDGLDDAIDWCPHLAGANVDADGDGVGDACDPRPGLVDRIVLFDPLTSQSASIDTSGGTWAYAADSIVHSSAAFAELDRTVTYSNADIWLGFDVQVISGTLQQIILHPSVGFETPRYYGQLYKTGGTNESSLVRYDGGYATLDNTPLAAAGVHTGALTIHMRLNVAGAATFTASWPGEPYTTTATLPNYNGATKFRIMVEGVQIAIRYMVVVAP